jgi:enamine deaminase RidA (YjgF/YER057c/UK114 family)
VHRGLRRRIGQRCRCAARGARRTDSRYGDEDEFVELRKAYFTNGYPASALIGVHPLARPEILLEIQAFAVLDQ